MAVCQVRRYAKRGNVSGFSGFLSFPPSPNPAFKSISAEGKPGLPSFLPFSSWTLGWWYQKWIYTLVVPFLSHINVIWFLDERWQFSSDYSSTEARKLWVKVGSGLDSRSVY